MDCFDCLTIRLNLKIKLECWAGDGFLLFFLSEFDLSEVCSLIAESVDVVFPRDQSSLVVGKIKKMFSAKTVELPVFDQKGENRAFFDFDSHQEIGHLVMGNYAHFYHLFLRKLG